MDPSMTLMTFLFETEPSVKSVQLIGSWDNFTTWYTMKHDNRRGRGQWRGCHSFQNISGRDECSTLKSTRNGGLKMGNTYYYYYEVDGSTETHDPAQPFTTACPYLPGQTVNTLYVPILRNSRSRRASVNSLRQESFMTMDPQARFVTPVPQPAALVKPAIRRLGSSSSLLHDDLNSRRESTGPSWKRLFGRKGASRDIERPTNTGDDCEGDNSQFKTQSPDGRQRTRDISLESLRRFLVDDAPLPLGPNAQGSQSRKISHHVHDEVNDDDDDDNFAISTISEAQVFGTGLSPPPFQRTVRATDEPQRVPNSSSLTLTIKRNVKEQVLLKQQPAVLPSAYQLPNINPNSHCNWSPPMSSSTFTTPMSPHSLADEPVCFYDSNEEDDILSTDGEFSSYYSQPNMPNHENFKGYSLPRPSMEEKVSESANPQMTGLHQCSLLTNRYSEVPIMRTNFLGGPIDTGLDDFVNELDLMVEVISNKRN